MSEVYYAVHIFFSLKYKTWWSYYKFLKVAINFSLATFKTFARTPLLCLLQGETFALITSVTNESNSFAMLWLFICKSLSF